MDIEFVMMQDQEYRAWQDFVAEWKRVLPDHDMNDPKFNRLIRAVEVWGEHLAALRVSQDEGVRRVALFEKGKAYGDAVKESK